MTRGGAEPELPAGTVTFLLTDVERSTWLWEMAPDVAADAIARHYEVVEAAVAAHHGVRPEEQGEGDSVVAAFGSVVDAIQTAVDLQRALAAEDWPDGLAVRVRVGLHTGEARLRGSRNYTGAALHRCARLRDAGHGGQILVSSITASILGGALPEGTWLESRGHHRLRDLAGSEEVFELRWSGQADEFPPLRSLDVMPNNLPAPLTSFVGRAAELREVGRLLGEHRLVTLTGSGGCGKTRLAMQAAADAADRWPDGVWWIDLGSLSDPTLVAKTTASAMGLLVEPVGGPLRALTSWLRDRRLLVCLDTCEHLLDPVAEMVETLLSACPEVGVLATSREPLQLGGEMVWRVPSLVIEDAVQLFGDRAALVSGGPSAEPDDRGGVASLCRRVDCIPLAIELAAGWMRVLTVPQIEAGLDDRFRLLTRGPRGVVERHRTLAASTDWSYRLLGATDRMVFRRLAVFPGGFDLDAATAVCAQDPASRQEVIGALASLVDKSLVVIDDAESGGKARYRLLDTIREYASERLEAEGEIEATRERHLGHFLRLAEQAEPELERDQDTWRHVLELDHDNIRAALRWGLAREPEAGRRLAAAMARLWFLHGHIQEGATFLQEAMDVTPEDRSILQARLLVGSALVAAGGGQIASVADFASAALDIAVANGDDRIRARSLALSAYGSMYVDFAAADRLGLEAQLLGEATGDAFAADLGLLWRQCTRSAWDRRDEEVTLARELFDRAMPRGERFCASIARDGEVWACMFSGDLRRADALGAEAVEIAAPLGDYLVVGHTITNLAWAKCLSGDIDAGRKLMDPLARLVEDAGPGVEVAAMPVILGELHLAGGDLEGAVEWFQRAERYRAPHADNWIAAMALPGLAGALRRLGRHDEARRKVERAITLTRALPAPRPLAQALEEKAFLVAADDPGLAEDLHHEALAVRLEHDLRTFYVDSLDALAGLAARAESHTEAVRLAAASETARELMGYPRPAINQPDHDELLADLRAALSEEDFASAWSEGTHLSLDDAVAYVRRARGARARPSVGWASLTPTEQHVVRLVVEGLTNPQIAARLFVSRSTVKTHLTHIYTKLGLANRTELAALASTRSGDRGPGSE